MHTLIHTLTSLNIQDGQIILLVITGILLAFIGWVMLAINTAISTVKWSARIAVAVALAFILGVGSIIGAVKTGEARAHHTITNTSNIVHNVSHVTNHSGS